MAEHPLVRPGTWDAAIHAGVRHEYPGLPDAFAPGEVVLDIGCHTGAFCLLAAERGARVIGYEANRENHALAAINTARLPSVAIRFGAVWRSDQTDPHDVRFTPSAAGANTGGGSVLFDSVEDHWAAVPERGPDAEPPTLASHLVPTVGLDSVLAETGPVRFLKIDAEGSEFPILLTSRRLDLVEAIGGEYHELTDAEMARLAAEARVGDATYRVDLLRGTLEAAGFVVAVRPDASGRRGLFSAERPEVTAPAAPRGR